MENFATILTGKSRKHLVPLPNTLSDKHSLQPEVVEAFLALQQAAKEAGFNLQPASTFRDFERQKLIWNTKFNSERKVHDDDGVAIDMSVLSDFEKCKAMLKWSAVPGASRHHWGTEIDIFDPDLLPENTPLLLEPWEYVKGGYFAELTDWLHHYAEQFGFFFPFDGTHSKVGFEPWHISYYPIATEYEKLFSDEMLKAAWQDEDVAGKTCLIEHFEELLGICPSTHNTY